MNNSYEVQLLAKEFEAINGKGISLSPHSINGLKSFKLEKVKALDILVR